MKWDLKFKQKVAGKSAKGRVQHSRMAFSARNHGSICGYPRWFEDGQLPGSAGILPAPGGPVNRHYTIWLGVWVVAAAP
jgi:hypothetical protein